MVLEKHYFNNTDNFHKFEGISGIYALIYKDQVLYVGQSINVCKRLFAHHGMRGNINKHIKEYNKTKNEWALNKARLYSFLFNNQPFIYFIVLPTDKDKLNEVEEHYISKYKPEYNWAGVRGNYKPVDRYKEAAGGQKVG